MPVECTAWCRSERCAGCCQARSGWGSADIRNPRWNDVTSRYIMLLTVLYEGSISPALRGLNESERGGEALIEPTCDILRGVERDCSL